MMGWKLSDLFRYVLKKRGDRMGKKRKVGKLTAPNCPDCGRYMDLVEAWVCKTCGKLKK